MRHDRLQGACPPILENFSAARSHTIYFTRVKRLDIFHRTGMHLQQVHARRSQQRSDTNFRLRQRDLQHAVAGSDVQGLVADQRYIVRP
jgi:hypothetical protein